MKKDSASSASQPGFFAEVEEADSSWAIGRPVRPEETVKMGLDAAWHHLGPCFASVKLDGYRLQIQRDNEQVWLFTRKGEDWTYRFPEVVQAVDRQIVPGRVVLDSELLAFDPGAGRQLPRDFVTSSQHRNYRVVLFDILHLDGISLYDIPLASRLEILGQVIDPDTTGILTVAEEIPIGTKEEIREFYDTCLQRGEEGLILKGRDALYRPGKRNPQRVKVKYVDTIDATVLGFDSSQSQAMPDAIGALVVGVYDEETDTFVSIARAPKGGISNPEWDELCERLYAIRTDLRPPNVSVVERPDCWVRPEIVVEVDGHGRVPSRSYAAGRDPGGVGYALADPRLSARGVRLDKDPADSTTLSQFLDMRLVPGHSESSAGDDADDAHEDVQLPLL